MLQVMLKLVRAWSCGGKLRDLELYYEIIIFLYCIMNNFSILVLK